MLKFRFLFFPLVILLCSYINSSFAQLAITVTPTDVNCFGGTDGVIQLNIAATAPLATAPFTVELQYRFFDGSFTTLAFYTGTSTTNFSFQQGNGSMNQPGADAFGIPANDPGDNYRVIVSSAGTGTFLQRNKSFTRRNYM